jgi:hypothetical protein
MGRLGVHAHMNDEGPRMRAYRSPPGRADRFTTGVNRTAESAA